MGTDSNPAIELLVAQITELEQKANAYRASVNVLCEKDGVPPMFPDVGGGGGGVRSPVREASGEPVQIKPDAFYGRPQQTAVRELLALRYAAGTGPAKPAEILEGLRAGGYQVEAKTDEVALVGLRAMLRKRTAVFHKLPNGTWGLREWYPNVKHPKESAEKGVPPKEGGSQSTEPSDESETKAADDNDESSAA